MTKCVKEGGFHHHSSRSLFVLLFQNMKDLTISAFGCHQEKLVFHLPVSDVCPAHGLATSTARQKLICVLKKRVRTPLQSSGCPRAAMQVGLFFGYYTEEWCPTNERMRASKRYLRCSSRSPERCGLFAYSPSSSLMTTSEISQHL